MITVKTSICDVASGMNASDLEHMHLCSFSMFGTLPSSWMSIGISLMSGSRSVDLIGSVISSLCGRGERMQLIGYELAASLLGCSVGSGGKRAPNTNEVFL